MNPKFERISKETNESPFLFLNKRFPCKIKEKILDLIRNFYFSLIFENLRELLIVFSISKIKIKS